MANIKIQQLAAKTTPENKDVLVIEDSVSTKKMAFDNLRDGIFTSYHTAIADVPNSDDRSGWDNMPSGFYYISAVKTGYPEQYALIFHNKRPGLTHQISIGASLYVRRFNDTQSMDWETLGNFVYMGKASMGEQWSGDIQFYKDSFGTVHMYTDTKVTPRNTTTALAAGTLIATVPSGCEPGAHVNILLYNSEWGRTGPGFQLTDNGKIFIRLGISDSSPFRSNLDDFRFNQMYRVV